MSVCQIYNTYMSQGMVTAKGKLNKSSYFGGASLREHLTKESRFLSGIVQITSPPL